MKGRKKLLIVALLCAAVMALCFAFAACGHTHDYLKNDAVWSDDYSYVTFIVGCKDCDLEEEVVAASSVKESKDPTETEDGYIIYEASATYDGFILKETTKIVLPKTGADTGTSAESIALSATSVSLKAGEITTVTVTDTTVSDVTVSSANEACATAEVSGTTITITGVAEGSTTITVSGGGKTASISVTVSSSSTVSPVVESITLSANELTLDVNTSSTVIATVAMSDGSAYSEAITATSSSTGVSATVEGSTIAITGNSVGEYTVTVSCGEKEATVSVKVTNPTVKSLTLSKDTVTIEAGSSDSVEVTVTMSSGTSIPTINVSTESDSLVVGLGADGKTITIQALSVEQDTKATITVSCGDKTATISVTITYKENAGSGVQDITLSSSSVTIKEGETATVIVTVTMSDGGATVPDITISKNNSCINATLSNNTITIEGVSEGTATVTVVCGEKSATISVTVQADPATVESISVTPAEMTIMEGESATANVTVTMSKEGAEVPAISLSSSNDNITASINGTTITVTGSGVAQGTVTITCGEKTATITVSVVAYVKRISVSPSTVSLDTNTTANVTVTVEMSSTDATVPTISAISNNTSIATVSLSGSTITITGVAAGTTKITVSCEDQTATISVTVTEPTVTNISLDKTTVSIEEGATATVTATVTMSSTNATVPSISAVCDNTSYATVSVSSTTITITGVSAGSATITVSCGDKTATISVTVTATQTGGDEGEGGEETDQGYTINIDFSNYENDAFSLEVSGKYYINTTEGISLDENGYLVLTDANEVTEESPTKKANFSTQYGVGASYLQTGGSSNSSLSMRLDVSGYTGGTLSVTIEFASTSSSNNRTLCISTANNTSNALTGASATSAGNTSTTLTYTGTISNDLLYIVWDGNANIYSIEITVTPAGENPDEGESGGSTGGDEDIEGYEWVTTYADLEAALNTAGGSGSSYKTTSDLTVGKFTFGSGVYFEYNNTNFSNDYDVNNQQKNIYFTVSGTKNNLAFDMVNASKDVSGGIVSLYKEGESSALYTWDYPSEKTTVDVYKDKGAYLEAGTYYIGSVGSLRIGNLYVEEYLEESDPESISAKATNVDFLIGTTLSITDLGLNVTLNYENGRQDALTASQLETDLSTLTLQAGANTVTITYSLEGYDEFTTTVTIYAYTVESIEISDFSLDSSRVTNPVQKIYLVGDNVSYDNAAVTATAYYGSDGDKVTKEFILTDSQVTFGTYDSSNNEVKEAFSGAGTYDVRATVNVSLIEGASVTKTYEIHVVSVDNSTDITTVNVEQSESASLYTQDATTGQYTVGTITDALCLIKLMGATDSERKFINVGEGQYNEKIYIDIPNLSLIGSNPSDTDNLGTRSEVTEIVFDAMNGVMDPSGTITYSTTGSATVTIASGATGFYAANITFRNYWNTNALYNEALKITSSTQADAAYITADKVYFYNVTFTGYHDTLEAENGRQYYDHCYIEGRTDYIFGNDSTCYFSYCTLHTIGGGSSTNGGYVMAIKGGTSSAYVEYGYVFNYCNFTSDLESYYADETVADDFAYTTEGTVSIARTWDNNDGECYMHIAILNSTLDAGYSTKAYGDTSTDNKNARYSVMSTSAPNPDYLLEYNNTGAGAISSSLSGTCTVIDSETAANFTIDYIFAATNGTYTYSDSWDGKCDVIKIAVQTSESDTSVLYTIYGTNSMSLSDLKAAIDLRLTDAASDKIYNASTNTEITSSITSDTTIYFTTGEIDYTFTESVTYTINDYTTVNSGETMYIGNILVSGGQSGSFVSNGEGNGWWKLTGDASMSFTITAGTSVSWTSYDEALAATIDDTEVTMTETGSSGNYVYTYTATTDCTLVISMASGKSQLYVSDIVVSVPVIYKIGDVIDLSDYSGADIQNTTGEYKGISIDATASGAKFAHNSSGCVQYNSGTIMYVNVEEGATIKVNYYSGQLESCTVSVENGVVTITATGATYIVSLEVIAIDASSGGDDNPGGEDEGEETPITMGSVTITSQPDGSMKVGDILDLGVEATLSNGNSYTGTITWSSSDESVVTVDENGKITAIGAGTATIYASGTYEGTTVTGQCTITVVAESTGGTTITSGTVEYKAYHDGETDDDGNDKKTGYYINSDENNEYVTITNTASSFLSKEKSTQDGSVTLTDYAEIKDADGNSKKYISITIADAVESASITVYASHTSSSSTRTIYIGSTQDDQTNPLASLAIGGDDGENTTYLYPVTAENLTSGTYYVYSSGSSDTVHVYAVVVTYSLESAAPESGAITYSAGYNESLAVEAAVVSNSLSDITVEYKADEASNAVYTEFTDYSLISLSNYTLRVDMVGLTAGNYSVKITDGDNSYTTSITVSAYDRSGYAHFNYDSGVGAYNDDGTLKSGALVIYLTESNKNDISDSAYVNGEKVDITSLFNGQPYSIGYFLNNNQYGSSDRDNYGVKAACDIYGGVDIRVIGTVNAEDTTDCKNTLIEGLTKFVYSDGDTSDSNGGSAGDNGRMARMTDAYNVTIEGIGEDACLWGWGIHFMCYNDATGKDGTTKVGTSFEVRNLTFKNYAEDAIGMEGKQSDTELNAPVQRCWVHNNTFYVGYCEESADTEDNDKLDGDGSCDFKRGMYFTLSYNYFEGCHKTNLIGSGNSDLLYNVTMHHNYWKECSQRMPLVRCANVHFYNNYIDGTGNTIGIQSARMNAYIYSEYNYFYNCSALTYQMDSGSAIKSYQNTFDSCGSTSEMSIVTDREEKVTNSCAYSYGNIDYSSFDTDSTLFYYDEAGKCSDVELLTDAAQAKEDCIAYSGVNQRKA